MKHNLLFVFLLSIPFSAFAQQKCTIIYVVSEGFIIESGTSKIMIDALPSLRFLKKQNVPQSVIDSMHNAGYPFNNIDIAFVTHCHHDHFDPNLVVTFMLESENTTLVCTQQVYNIIKVLGGYYSIKHRIYTISEQNHQVEWHSANGYSFKSLPLTHGAYMELDTLTGKKVNRHAHIQHTGYVIKINDITVLHTGDNHLLPKEKYAQFLLRNDSIDIAFFESLFWGRKRFPERQFVVDSLIGAKYNVIMHLNMGDDLSWVKTELRETYPEIVHFSYPLEVKEFDL